MKDLEVGGDASINGNTTIGGYATIGGTLSVGSTSTMRTILPAADLTYSLGSSTSRWRSIYTNGIYTSDLTISATTPTYAGGIDVGTEVYSLDISGKNAYVGHAQIGSDEFSVFDVTIPSNPQRLSGIDIGTGHIVYDVESIGNYAYIASTQDEYNNYDIQLIDVSNPTALSKISGVATNATECRDILVSGNYVYAACNNATDSIDDFYIIDYSNKNSPVIATSTNITAGAATSIEKYGDYVIVGTQNATNYSVGDDILIFNVSNPYLATFVDGYDIGANEVTSLAIQGNLLMVGSQNGVSGQEFMLFDIADPSNITYLGGTDLSGVEYVQAIQPAGNYAYVLHESASTDIDIINIASTTDVVLETGIDLGATDYHDMKLDGAMLYVGTTGASNYSNYEFTIFELSGLTTPSADIGDLFAGNMNVSEDAMFNKDVYINSGLTVGKYGINLLGQLSTASSSKFYDLMRTSDIRPLISDTYDLGTDAFRYQNGYLSGTVSSKPITEIRQGGYNVGSAVYSVYVKGKYLYVGTQDEAVTGRLEDFQIYDISNPEHPAYISGVNIGNSYDVQSIQIIGSYAYLTYYNIGSLEGALYIYDISDPENIVFKDYATTPSVNSNPYSLAVYGKYAYVINQDAGVNYLNTYDVSDPSNIEWKNTVTMTGGTQNSSLNVANGKLYIGSNNVTTYSSYDLLIFNLVNPAKPTYLGGANIDTGSIYDIYISDKYAYIGTTMDNIYIVNLSSSTAPTVVNTINAGANNIQDIKMMDDYLVVGTLDNGSTSDNEVLVYDVSSSTNVGSPVMEINVGDSPVYNMALYGKNLVIGTLNATANSEDFQIYDIGGFKAQAADIGSLRTNILRVTEEGYIGNNLHTNGVYAGSGGIRSGYVITAQTTSTLADLQIIGRVKSNWLPYIDNTYDLGSATYRWRNLQAVNATFTSMYLSVTATNINTFIQNGNLFGAAATLGTNGANIMSFETNNVGRFGINTSGAMYPITTNSFDLGLTTKRWNNIWGGTFHVGTSTWDISQLANGSFSMKRSGNSFIDITANSSDNLSIGNLSGSSFTTGQRNVALGSYTNSVLESGNDNTAIGKDAFYTFIGGSYNTAVGSGSLRGSSSDQIAYYNTGVGARSLYSLNTGASNTAVGYESLYATTNGAFNTAFGLQALRSNTTGAVNTAIGTLSLYSNQTGTNNIAVGPGALYANINGSDSVAIGFGALYDNLASDTIGIGKNALENNTTGLHNTAVGTSALTFSITGSNNTALGFSAMKGGAGSNSHNTAIGSNSLFSITTGASNTAIGFDGLYSNTTGNTNVSIGLNNLFSNQSGNDNVAAGSFALYGNTGSQNTAVGLSALYSNTSGSENTAFGDSALYLKQIGNSNTALGAYAMRGSGGTNYNAINNVAVGNRALSNISGNGSYNTAIGNSSLYSVSTGASNTAVGYESMRGNTTGNRNIGIGMNALYSNTAGIRNSVIGHNAGYSIQGSYNTLNGADSGYSITAGNYNTAMGYRSFFGGAGSPVASFNTGIGSFALSNITTGASNTAVGYTAGANITTGYKNVAIGLESLYTNGVGSNNVAIGSGAARTNSTGNEIVAIGAEALYNNTATGNTAVGFGSMIMNSTGVRNTSFGSRTLIENETGDWNTAVGYYALNGDGSGASHSFNTAIGSGSMGIIETASENTSFGFNNLASLTTGASNTSMGFESLINNADGYGNIAIGYKAMTSSTGSVQNIAIGTYALNSVIDDNSFTNVAVGEGALTNFVGRSATAIGYAALFYAGPTDTENVAFGFMAGYGTGGGATFVTDNTAVGYQALYTNLSGVGNTALGSRAINTGTDIDYRTALGRNALSNSGSYGATAVGVSAGDGLLSTGGYFTAIGYGAGLFTSSGDWNTYVGYNSGIYNTTGGVNTAVGAQSMYTNITGGYNTSLGQGAIYTLDGGSNNTSIGAHSGFYTSSTTSYNTMLGYRALYGSPTQGTSGDYNSALGALTMEDNTTGHRNVAVGAVSLTNNTTGYHNVGIGVDSLQQNTSGYGNVGIGFEASLFNSSGDYNTAAGFDALKGVTGNSHSNNTAVGGYVLDAITTGSDNSAMGYGALTNITTLGNSTAMGMNSLNSLSSGSGNTSYGYESGYFTGTGSNNTIMGFHAFYGTSGHNSGWNVVVGSYALDDATSVAGNNVAIGYDALGVVSTADYDVGVGYSAGNTHQTGWGVTSFGAISDVSGSNFTNVTALGYSAYVTSSARAGIGNGQDVGGSSAWNDWSDARMKYDIADNNLGLEFINALRPRSFRFTATSTVSHAGRLEEGFIAQEVEQTMLDLDVNFSGLMLPENSSDYYRLAYSKFTIPLVNSVQEISASSSPLWNGIAIDSNFAALEEPFMQVDTDGNIAYKGVSITSKGIATSSTQAFDSYTFSYKGSAWNTDTAQEITTSFDVFNNTISATSSELKFIYTTGTGFTQNLLTITNSGDVHVSGDLHVGRRLYLGSNTSGEASTSTYIFVDDTLSPTSTYIATNADGWQTESTYDYAERYESSEDLIPGDLVTTDPSGVNLVKRATSPSEPLLGIVSTKPGFVTGRHYEGWYPIALAGRVPTRVSTVDGAIRVGDYLTVSSNYPGVAVKATAGSNTIGVALEDYDNAEVGLISVFVERDGSNGANNQQCNCLRSNEHYQIHGN